MKKRVAVILSGCGVYDGAEIHESVLTLLHLEEAGLEPVCLAPDVEQFHVIDHLQGAPADEKRSVLVEAARIARGAISPLGNAAIEDVDAVVLPGGFGAAKNLCSFAVDGADAKVEASVAAFLRAAHDAGKPIGLICIAPVIGALLFGQEGIRLTIGNDESTATAIQGWGAEHVEAKVDEIVVDERLRVVSTPAYMLGQSVGEVSVGIHKLVNQLAAWLA